MSLNNALKFAKNKKVVKVPFRFQFPVDTKEEFKELCEKYDITMSNMILELIKNSIRKDKEDIANELITFLKGLLIGKNGSGITVLEDGTSQAVVDRLYVKIKAVFDELEVKKKTHVGGEQIISPAGMKCVRVEELDESYRCFFLSEVDGVTINNEFTVGTLALAQEFNIKEGTSHNVSNRYYWREVTGVGTDYIDLNKTNADKDSDIPVAGDDIIGLGHLTDITRQAAIILSSVNETSPSIILSHPAWVCGLKPWNLLNQNTQLPSHPAWVCGLKQL